MSILDIGPQVSTRVNDPASVDAAVLSRFSARAYLPRSVDRSDDGHAKTKVPCKVMVKF